MTQLIKTSLESLEWGDGRRPISHITLRSSLNNCVILVVLNKIFIKIFRTLYVFNLIVDCYKVIKFMLLKSSNIKHCLCLIMNVGASELWQSLSIFVPEYLSSWQLEAVQVQVHDQAALVTREVSSARSATNSQYYWAPLANPGWYFNIYWDHQ